ncbi:DUF2586 domain-containing protein [Orbus wheelerorum]|uniref:DUF2586 domain-containing protein n=1 Tax=Orbus wheelerorum TaxID=3074111 RepID=UPI00370D6D83
MTWPAVEVNQLNLMQGETKEVERRYLFIGNAPKNKGKIISVDTTTNFDDVLGVADSALKRGLIAAMTNAGSGWFASVGVLNTDQDWIDVVQAAQSIGSFETVVYAENVNSKEDINKAVNQRALLMAKFARWTRFILGVEGLQAKETWSGYESRLAALQSGIAEYGVTLVPMIYGNEPFVNAGRGCNRSVSIADTLARVQTGAVKDLGRDNKPLDADGVELPLSTLKTLESNRYSVPMWYPALDGMYWADDRTLDAEGGDYQSAETVRVVDKVARKILLKGIAKIGDRSFNSSIISIKANQSYFLGDLREMAKASQINGIQFPGEVKTPQDGDITITWINNKTVQIYVVVRVTDIPLKITINIMINNDIETE